MKKFFFTIAAFALSLAACNKVEEEKIDPSHAAKEYHFCIPASMETQTRAVDFSGTDPETGAPTAVATFAAGDSVFVFNETKEVIACNAEGKPIALGLTESDITNGGKNCTLAGDLTFYKYEGDSWTAVTIDEGDSYVLLYNLDGIYPDDPLYCDFWYTEQDGTAAGVADHAVANVTMTDDGGVLKPTSTAVFTNVQSMFRFQFVDGNGTAISVKNLIISSKNWAVVSYFFPLLTDPTYKFRRDDIPVSLVASTADYIYVALCYNEILAAGDELEFKAITADGKVYTGAKAVPDGGFVSGNYYYNSAPITLTRDASQDFIMPDIVWTNPDTPIGLDFKGQCRVYDENIDLTMSGTSRNCWFCSEHSGTIRLNGLNATGADRFFTCSENYAANDNCPPFTVELLNGSVNTIKNTYDCIFAKILKLSGNGTLTVTAKEADRCGIYGSTNYEYYSNLHDTTGELDVSAQLAAEGYTVIRSARTDNADGTYTWTYTVAPL